MLDGVSVITKGMNSGVSPRLLASDQLAWAVNVTCRQSLPKTRPVWRKVPLVYPDDNGATQTAATEGLFQGASFHQGYGGQENVLLTSIAGVIYRYRVATTNEVQALPLAGAANSPIAPQTWMWQSEDFTIIQNGLAYPLFFDGAGLRRSLGPPGEELPAGTVGAYVQGRNWMALQDRQSYIAGDLVYSHGPTGLYNGRDAVLKTTENTFLSGGGAFAVPITAGLINAMTSVSIPDTSLGQGPLLVATGNSIFSIQVPFLREEWATTQYPLITLGLPSYGPLSQWSTVVVNGDVWYRARDGIRSYTIARRDFNTWVNTPLSQEMERVISADSQILLDYASRVLFNNRLLLTCSPFRNICRGFAHRGLIALDFNNISNLTTRVSPAYDGLWTGLSILRILKGVFNGVERCFAFVLDSCERVCLYELLLDGAGLFDHNGATDRAVESVLETRSMVYPDRGNMLKRLKTADLFLDRLAGPGEGLVPIDFQYRSDEHPLWQGWHSFALCAPVKDCEREACDPLQNLWSGYRTFIRLPEPTDECNEVTGRQMRTGYEFQVRFAWTGYAQLNRLLVWATPAPESLATACPSTETCRLIAGCDENPFTYEVENGECESAPANCVTGEPGQPAPAPTPPDETPPPPLTQYPEQPALWPTPTEYWPPTTGWPPPPPSEPVIYNPPTFIPDMGCSGSQINDYAWRYSNSGSPIRTVRFAGGTDLDDPNTLFSAEARLWLMWHVTAVFAEFGALTGLIYTDIQLYWDWDTGSEGWNAEALRVGDTSISYASPGWTLKMAYCTT